MLIKKPSDVRASDITPEPVYRERRTLIRAALAGSAALVAGCDGDATDARAAAPAAAAKPAAQPSDAPAPTYANLVQSPYSTTEQRSSWRDITTYNNFYEFGLDKSDPAKNAGSLVTKPWTVTVSGHANKTGTYALEDLVPPTLEERIYRMRCVEGWSMVIPWVGFPLGELLKRFEPTSRAKYVAFKTLLDPGQMPGQRSGPFQPAVLDWPYEEGLRIDEAMHPLTILAVGVYGRELPNQNGAPLRLVVPWKYGFKGIKSIVAIEFVEDQPPTSWNKATPNEYGFYSNVNPDVRHPRWSQATERRIAEGTSLFAQRIPTKRFNGYDEVASLYAGMDLKENF